MEKNADCVFNLEANRIIGLHTLPANLPHHCRKVKTSPPAGFEKPAMDGAREVRTRTRQASDEAVR
jgi:hypothetical protein